MLVRKVTFGKTLFTHTTAMIQIVHRLYVIVLGYVTFKINKFFVDIYHNFIADKMSYQAE